MRLQLEPWVTMCMIFNPEDVSWFIDFERSVAWAWLARLEREKVGDPAPAKGDRVSTSPISEGVIFDYDETGPRLRIFMPDPTEDEIRTVIQEACMFKLVTFGSVIFLLARFGDMKWMDAPYSIHLLRPEDRKLCAEFFDGRRYGLMVTLIDSNRNVQCGGRLVTWNPDFSGIFHHLVKRQLECQFSRLEHDETIRNIYATTTSANMASQAFAFTNGGD